MDQNQLQARIDAALIDRQSGRAWVYSSPYLSSLAADLQDKLRKAAESGGLEAMLDEFDRLAQAENSDRLRIALAQVLFNDPTRQRLGLRLP